MLFRIIENLHWVTWAAALTFFLYVIEREDQVALYISLLDITIVCVAILVPGFLWLIVKGKFCFFPWTHKKD
ncbi:MAG: hypothetical protein CMM44_02860 [Rhodospirillaceae bacterium]|nr:hypothetical protein [Rhodospirillaceae bacterium]